MPIKGRKIAGNEMKRISPHHIFQEVITYISGITWHFDKRSSRN